MLIKLLQTGFSLPQSLAFILSLEQAPIAQRFQQTLKNDGTLTAAFKAIDASPLVLAQIQLALIHGDLLQTLVQINQQWRYQTRQKQQLMKVLAYPLLLFAFLFLMLLGLRLYLLPQLQAFMTETSPTIWLIENLPLILAGMLGSGLLLVGSVRWQLRKRSAIEKVSFLVKLPLVGTLYCWYLTAFFALEWGKLFSQGFEMRQAVQIMQESPYDLMRELGVDFHQQLQAGRLFSEALLSCPFLSKELRLLVLKGEKVGQLGQELLIYQEWLLEKLVAKMEKLLTYIQPLVFVMIALFIVGIYAALLLPIYGNLGG